MTRTHTLQGYESGMSLLSASISKSFCNDKWNVTVSGTIGLGHGGNLIWTSYNKGNDFNSTNSFKEPVKNISLGISYTFGSKKQTMMMIGCRLAANHIQANIESKKS